MSRLTPSRSPHSRRDLLLLFHHGLYPLRHLEPASPSRTLSELSGHLPQVRRTGVFRSIDTVTEPRDLHFPGQHVSNNVVDALIVGILADRHEHLHHLSVGPAMQGALQGWRCRQRLPSVCPLRVAAATLAANVDAFNS